MLWFPVSSVELFDAWCSRGNCLLHEPVEQLAPVSRESPVESECKLVEVRLEVMRGYASLVGAAKPTFEKEDQ